MAFEVALAGFLAPFQSVFNITDEAPTSLKMIYLAIILSGNAPRRNRLLFGLPHKCWSRSSKYLQQDALIFFEEDRSITLLSAGNLATSQSVIAKSRS